jgi:hypothetical protein
LLAFCDEQQFFALSDIELERVAHRSLPDCAQTLSDIDLLSGLLSDILSGILTVSQRPVVRLHLEQNLLRQRSSEVEQKLFAILLDKNLRLQNKSFANDIFLGKSIF